MNIKSLLAPFLLMSLVSCQMPGDSKESSTTQYPVSIKLGHYSTAGLGDLFIPSAYANVSELKACFKRLRFKKDITDSTPDDNSPGNDDNSPDDNSSGSDDGVPHVEDNIDFNIGLVTLTDSGTLLGSVNLPEGTYYRVEFDLEPSCAGGKSLSLTNDYGSYSSGTKIKIKFDGVFVVNGPQSLELGVQEIMDAANTYNGSLPIEEVFESVSGSL